MANGIKLELDLEAQRAIRTLSKLTKDMDKFGKTSEKSVNRISSSFSVLQGVVGGAAIVGGFRLLSRTFINASRDAIEFSKSLAEINTILDDNQQITEENRRTFLRFSSQFTGTAVTQARGFYNIVSAGITDTAEAMGVLAVANKAAVAGLTSIDSAAKVLVSSINAFGKDSIPNAAFAADKLFLAVRRGQLTFNDLSNGIGRSLAIASKAGLKFGELTGTLAFLTKTGISTEEAVTGIRQLLVSVIKPSEGAAKVARDLGIEFNTAAIRSKGFPAFLQQLIEKTGGSEEQLAKLFPNVRALTPILQTAGKGFKEFSEIVEEAIGDTTGTTDKAFKRISDSAGFQLERLGQQLKNLPQQFLVSFEEPLADATKAVRAFISENGIGLIGKGINFAINAFGFFDAAIVKTKNFIADIANFLLSVGVKWSEFVLNVNQAAQSVQKFLGLPVAEAQKKEEAALKSRIMALKEAIKVGEEEQGERLASYKERSKLVADFQNKVNESIAKEEAANKRKNENLLAQDKEYFEQKQEQATNASTNQFNALQELKAAQVELEAQQETEAQIVKDLQRSEEFEKLRAGLGQEQALRAITRAKELQESGKQVEAKKVLSDSLRKAEQQNIFAVQKYEELSNKQRLANLKGTLGNISSLMSQSNETLFNIGKAAAVGQATIDGIAAVQKALASAPPPINFALAGLVGVATAANIAKIASTPKPKFNEGGFINAGASTGDLVDVRAQRGEAILNPSQQRNFMELANGAGGNGELLASIDDKLSLLIQKDTVLMANGRAIAQTVREEIRNGFRIA